MSEIDEIKFFSSWMQNIGSDGSGNKLGAGEKQLADQNISVSFGRFQKKNPYSLKKYFQTAAIFF